MRHADPELRAALIQRLTEPEPSERVGVQLALALARIMRSEANRGQAAVLEGFAEALRRSSLPGHALLALLHTGKELRSMRLPAQRRLAAMVDAAAAAAVAPRARAGVRTGWRDGGGRALGDAAHQGRAAAPRPPLARRPAARCAGARGGGRGRRLGGRAALRGRARAGGGRAAAERRAGGGRRRAARCGRHR
mmetsp:Transcript_41241/g.113438  ORF Transcript_41241/g.113438 Transcript_41241/m.113438 type:complete len:193 (+) Transcript_41241:101-679(+)